MKFNLVQNIKDCGQAIIDNAENIAENLPIYSRDLCLSCYPSEKDSAIYVNVSYDFIPEKFINRCSKGESET